MELIIENLLNSFFKEMNEWERHAYQFANQYLEKGEDFPRDDLKKSLTIIYDKYLIKKERRLGRLENLNFGDPPEYDASLENIDNIEIKNKSATVTTDRIYAGKSRNRIYKLKQSNDVWRIDSIKEFYERDEKWHIVHL